MSQTDESSKERTSVVRRGYERQLSGFEECKGSESWKSPFFFVQAADTQLGMIQVWGDGTIRY